MDWQAAGDWPGGTPGRDGTPGQDAGLPDLAALLAAFGHGGTWEAAVPTAALAVALERAAGPGGRTTARTPMRSSGSFASGRRSNRGQPRACWARCGR